MFVRGAVILEIPQVVYYQNIGDDQANRYRHPPRCGADRTGLHIIRPGDAHRSEENENKYYEDDDGNVYGKLPQFVVDAWKRDGKL